MPDIAIYLINLKIDIDKKKRMKILLKNLGLEACIIEAIYGKELNQDEIEKVYIDSEDNNLLNRALTVGEIGCTLSHLSIYQDIIKKRIPYALILEDDILIEVDIVNFIEDLLQKLPSQWDTILFGHHCKVSRYSPSRTSFHNRMKINNKYSLHRLVEPAYGTYGYMVSQNGARKLINKNEFISKPIDHYTGNNSELDIYAILPFLIHVNIADSEKSHISLERKQAEKISPNNGNNIRLKDKLKKICVLNKCATYKNAVLWQLKIFMKQIKPWNSNV